MVQMPFLKMKTKLSRTSLERKSGLRVCQKSTTIANNSWTNFRISKHAAEFDSNIHNFFNVSSNEKHDHKSGCYDDLEGKEVLDGERLHFQRQPPSFIDPVSTETADITVVLPNMDAYLSPASASPQTNHGELVNVHTGPQATRACICGPHGVIPDGIDGRDEPWRLRPEDNECGVSDFSIPEAADLTLDLSLFSDDMYAVDGDMFFGLNGDYLMMHFCDDSSLTDLLDFKLSEMVVDHDDTPTNPFSMLTEPRPTTQEPDLVRYESGLPDCLDSFFLCEDLPDSPENTLSDEAPTKSVTLVLDLDETLVHSSMVECKDADFSFTVECNMKQQKVYVKRRPYLTQFLKRVAEIFDVIVFTASQSNYGEQLLDVIDPGRKLISRRAFRESCVFSDGSYTKDLTVLGLDLAKVAIIDNSPQVFRLQVNNGIPIMSWFDDPSDCALITLLPFLERLAAADDVRPIIADKFGKTGVVSL